MFTFLTLIPINHNETRLHVDDLTTKNSNRENVTPNKQCKATREKETSMHQKMSLLDEKQNNDMKEEIVCLFGGNGGCLQQSEKKRYQKD